jgi:hypothetical protein
MKKLFFTMILIFLSVSSIFAQEGMWMLNQIKGLDLESKGLKIGVSDIYNTQKPALYNAIIQLGGGTASFVSKDGLIVTNHHVAYDAIQRASSEQRDYLKNGFLAINRTDEISAQGYTARLLQEMKDVTNEITSSVKGITDAMERQRKIQENIQAMTDDLEKGKTDIQARVSEMYNGKEYYLFVYKIFKDVRLVYAPPDMIGRFGGDIDNWMWPRHTGDFTFMRVYSAPDGTGRDYDPTNIPYKPKVWLKVSQTDLDDGDFTFILGFPGFTTRYRSSNSVNWNLNENYPFVIKNFKEIIKLTEDLTENSEEGKIKVASLQRGLENTQKNFEGKVEGMIKTNYLQKKIDFEKEFMSWLDKNPAQKEKYGTIFSDEKKFYDILEKTKLKDNVLGMFGELSGTPLSVAIQIYNITKEIEKPETERQPGITKETFDRIKEQIPLNYANYYEPVDKALMVRTIKMAANLPADQRINGLKYITDNKMMPDAIVEGYWENSKLTDPDYVVSIIGKTSRELEALDDPFINMAAALYPESEELNEQGLRFNAGVTPIRKKYIDALYEWKGSNLYPDANGTMRFTFGPVRGYMPEDAVWYYPFTTLRGVINKEKNEDPFDVPDGLVDLYNNKDWGIYVDPELEQVPVAFTHMGDITGGNSGSPVMNANGELIGLAFDGNYESMISDWQYDADLQRVISVDIRYVLFITDKFGKAGFILDEMGVKH